LKNSPHKTLETKNKFHKYFFPAILIILTFAALSVNIDHSLAKITGNITNIPIKKSLASLHDFSVNPLYDLFSSQEIKSPDEKDSSMPTALKSEEKFSQKLNTDSLQNRKRYPFLSPFRRGEKYNIIFYFFESTANKYLNEKIAGRRILATWEKLAQNSISFKKHYTTFPFTANAVFSILTSAYDLPVKGIAINKYPKIHLKTAAEFLRSKGYKTAYMHSGNLDFTGQRAFLKHRFDTLVESRDLKKTSPYKKWLGWGLDDRALIQPVVDFARRNKDNPYFLAVAPINPHHPYIIPDEKYNVAREWIKKASGKDKKWFQYLNTLYFADSVLGEILAKLEQEKLMDHTLLFLIADHGEAFFQHNKNYNHALFVYEENVAVPFLIYNKKLIPKPIDFNGISRHIDILPSLLDILDIQKSPEIEGISLFRAHPEQMALVHTYWGVDDYLGVRDGNWKYILRVNDMFEELYDLSLDPGEKNNLASSMPQINARYKNFVLGARQHKREFYKRIQKN
jgi:arylsulfatase A-like enzyme